MKTRSAAKHQGFKTFAVVATVAMVYGCTPLGRNHISHSVPAAHTAGETHEFGPRRQARGAAIAVENGKRVAPQRETFERWSSAPPLSPGDRLQIEIDNGDGFSGRYEIGIDGTLRLPHINPLEVIGSDPKSVAGLISEALVSAELFRADRVRVSVSVHEWANIQVHVSGAVFNPGMVSINVRSPEERSLKTNLVSGDFPAERMLSSALRAAGGVRPDANITDIVLNRMGTSESVDYSGLLRGEPISQVPLMNGDSIVVASSGRFDRDLVGPSAITPPGVRVFLSNLTEPATGNSIAAVGKEASSLPYGSRLLTGAVSANCVGGIRSTSASRYAVLVRTDPISGREEVIERAIHDLFEAPHRDDINPLLMPNDSVSCYDSGLTNFRDILRMITEAVTPFGLLL